MHLLIYNLLTQAYFLGIKIASIWNPKARQWVHGRVGQWDWLEANITKQSAENQRLIWMHCASLGEFEQGRPVLEMLRKKQPELKILLTFFSPSGYEIRKNYPVADWVAYLPADSAKNARRFLAAVKPDLAIFIKYEFWFHYLINLKRQGIPTLLVSAIFRPGQPFFKWYGGLYRQMLGCFNSIMVQDEVSKLLLAQISVRNVQVAGDTRVDRVAEIAANPIDLPLVRQFCGDAPVLVCGSTWPADESLLYPIFRHESFSKWKFILAPHDIQPAHLEAIEAKMTVAFVRYSQLGNERSNARLLLIDNIGLLSSLYQFGKIAYIGGGFGQGIHNILEPSAYGLPVVFGRKFQKFAEARWLVESGGAFEIRNGEDLTITLQKLQNTTYLRAASAVVNAYIRGETGATSANLVQALSLLDGKYDF